MLLQCYNIIIANYNVIILLQRYNVITMLLQYYNYITMLLRCECDIVRMFVAGVEALFEGTEYRRYTEYRVGYRDSGTS